MADDHCERCGVADFETELFDFVTWAGDVLVICSSCERKQRELERLDAIERAGGEDL